MSEEPSAAQRTIGDVAPKLVELTDVVLFGDIWERPGLSKRDRGQFTVAAIVVLYPGSELPFHLGRALDNGVSQDELVERVPNLAFYAGWPKAMSAAVAVAKGMPRGEERGARLAPVPGPESHDGNDGGTRMKGTVRYGPRDVRFEERPARPSSNRPTPSSRSHSPSGVLRRLAQRLLGGAGREGRLRKSAALAPFPAAHGGGAVSPRRQPRAVPIAGALFSDGIESQHSKRE